MSPHCPAQAMICQKTPFEQIGVDVSQSHCLTRDIPMMAEGLTLTEQIQEGSFYEIDRSKLPFGTPSLLLESIRVVMVTVKNDQHLTVRFPSNNSLEAHFMKPSENPYPVMDEKFILGSQLAAEVLVRQISSREFRMDSSMAAFWCVQTPKTQTAPLPLTVYKPVEDVVQSKLGTCLSGLQSSNIKSWGERRLVSYVKNAKTISIDGQSSSHSIQAPVVKLEMQEECEDSAQLTESEDRRHGSSGNDGQHVSSIDQVEVDEIKKEMEEEFATTVMRPGKRKRKSLSKGKKVRTTNLNEKKVSRCKVGREKDHDSYRWAAQRYESAKKELYNVMKARHAACKNPISRHALRLEARKQIGDTGLLDHLLKHVVDTLAPGGTERFRRRWDSRGVMEYWLESADLVDIRKNAGVHDPYWTPPPGWKPGDPICNHNSDCAAVISALKEELGQMRGEMQVMAAEKHKHTLADLSVLGNVGTVESLNPTVFKERYNDLLKEKARREQELLEISQSLKKMELLMRK